MRRPRNASHILLVEGEDDKRVLPELIEANGIAWEDANKTPIVYIDALGGKEEVLKSGLIDTELKASGLRALGIILDADADAHLTWQRVKNACQSHQAIFPKSMPPHGFVGSIHDGLRIGVWIMPDNSTSGMLETFLRYLVPTESSDIWNFACSATTRARELGAPVPEHHLDKAHIHSWLAWQDPPGRPLHNALMERILNPSSSEAQVFIDWFRRLYLE